MLTSSAKAKGRRLAQRLADRVLATFPHLTERDAHPTSAGVTGNDLTLSQAAVQVFPFDAECKNQEHLNIWDSLAQVEKRNDPSINGLWPIRGLRPLVVFSRNHSADYVALRLDDFLNLLKRGWDGEDSRSTRRSDIPA